MGKFTPDPGSWKTDGVNNIFIEYIISNWEPILLLLLLLLLLVLLLLLREPENTFEFLELYF